jgi:A/G-specific adenine glycosylase
VATAQLDEATALTSWFDSHGRWFPWRGHTDPYAILVGEVLLQRTRADLVAPVFTHFLARLPTSRHLAVADPELIKTLTEPLGLRKRQPLLPALGRDLVDRHGGEVPRDLKDLLALPLVGPYVARAVRCMAYGEQEPMVDGGVVRVIRRLVGAEAPTSRAHNDDLVIETVQRLLGEDPRKLNLALIDLSATVCRRVPRCDNCPLVGVCATSALNEQTYD